MAAWIKPVDRIIAAIREHIEARQTLTSGDISVRVQESFDDGIIISCAEVIEAGLVAVHVRAIAEGIAERDVGSVGDGDAARVLDGGQLAPGIVGVTREESAGVAEDTDHVALQVLRKPVLRSVGLETDHRSGVVVQIQRAVGRIAYDLVSPT